MTNLVEILKNAPKGLELYSPVGGNVKLYSVKPNDMYPIVVENLIKNVFGFDKYGRANEYGECCLFPSSEHRNWNGWQKVLFKPGYFITYVGMSTPITAEVPKEGFPKEDDYLKSRFATTKEIETWYKYHPKSSICYVQDTPFTIDDFKPFDKVLAKDHGSSSSWRADIFSHYQRDPYSIYVCAAHCWRQCIPYNDETKHLLGTNEEYNGKYKTW